MKVMQQITNDGLPCGRRVAAIGLCALTIAAAGPASHSHGPEDTRSFIGAAEARLERAYEFNMRAGWVRDTDIREDTERLASEADRQLGELLVETAREATRRSAEGLGREDARKLHLLRSARLLQEGLGAPTPADPGKAREVVELRSTLAGAYGQRSYCPTPATCLDEGGLGQFMATSRDPAMLRRAWEGWHSSAREMRRPYARMVELSNAGAREIGYGDLGVMWRSSYDMPPHEFEAMVERLWRQVEPLYRELHCYVRARLEDRYSRAALPRDNLIPAHLTGDLYGQFFTGIEDLLISDGEPPSDVGAALRSRGYDARRLTSLSEELYRSMGFEPLPASFWDRSLFAKPAGREVQCYGTAWDIGPRDPRVLMCTEVSTEHLWAMHHELGHVHYYQAYAGQPFLFRDGANDAFHEALGDFIALSVTPDYLAGKGIGSGFQTDEQNRRFLMHQALQKVAVLPFSIAIDRWRWKVFSGEIKPDDYNRAWWALREHYQGISPPGERSADDFDPAGKYHIVINQPHVRYFLAHILQFQMLRSACRLAGHRGPLFRCSLAGRRDIGLRLSRMLSLGSSRPWREALAAFNGERELSADPLLEYFAPLRPFLKQQTRGRPCGWTPSINLRRGGRP